jgi:hypothetical protein
LTICLDEAQVRMARAASGKFTGDVKLISVSKLTRVFGVATRPSRKS